MEARRHAVLLREIAAMLGQVTGEDASWVGRITTATRLDDDLLLESIELAGLADLLRERYGEGVDLPGLLAGLDPDGLIALSVGDLVRHVASHGVADQPAVRR